MNVSGIGLSTSLFDNTSLNCSQSSNKVTASNTGDVATDQLIDRFKADNNPASKRIEQIMAKFMGGKELLPHELDYLAKNAPDSYKLVKEVLTERAQLKMRLEMAQNKLEAAQAYMDSLSMVKATKGTGEMEKKQVIKTMARVNQLGDAYGQFAGTLEYRELEDEEDKAKEIQEELKEDQEDTQETNKEIEKAPREVQGDLEQNASGEILPEKDNAVIDDEFLEANEQRKNKKKKKSSDTNLESVFQAKVNVGSFDAAIELRNKVNNLYKNNGNAHVTGRTRNQMDTSL